MHRPTPIVVFLLLLLSSSKLCARQPNFVVILADDQGWGDLGVTGNRNLETPNINSLAQDGATLQHFYVCQVCAPTRAEFLTGRYYPRTGVSGVSRGMERLNADETTIADLFKSAGYVTGCFGKWHNGTQSPYHPNDRGFDEFYGFTSGHWSHYFSPPLDRNGQRVRGNGFIIDDLTEQALEFIEANHEQPFFCYVPLNTPHSPMMVPDRFYQKFDGFMPEMRHRDIEKEDIMMTRAALALCENIDWNVGRILAKLDQLDLRDDTVVVYFSDNGPNSYRWNGGMKGRKGSLDEGGLRSPFFIRWPARIDPGLTVDQVVGAIDLLPTFVELADLDETESHGKPIDGRSFVPLLQPSGAGLGPRLLFSIKGDRVSVRTDRFRMDSDGHLYDIASDPGQGTDVAAEYPSLVHSLQRECALHLEEMKACFELFEDRPFTVGFGESTTLPARDGNANGEIERSSQAPNNSFFKSWTSTSDYIFWEVEVNVTGNYEAVVYYTCKDGNEGVTLQLSMDDASSTEAVVTEVFDPALYDKSRERVEASHYFAKDFNPLILGELELTRGRHTLRLRALDQKGPGIVDVHSVDLIRRPDR